MNRTKKIIEELKSVKAELLTKKSSSKITANELIDSDLDYQNPNNSLVDLTGEEGSLPILPNSPEMPLQVTSQPLITEISFHPGHLGVTAVWLTGEIERVAEGGQAHNFGVQSGWRITHIDDEVYSVAGLDAKTRGTVDYILKFAIPQDDADYKNRIKDPPRKSKFKRPIMAEERENFESKISELTEKIEGYDLEVKALTTRNAELEKEHQEMTRLRVKVELLRASRQMFMNQTKEIQKQMLEWKEKATTFDQKYAKLLEGRGGKPIFGINGKGIKPPQRRGSVNRIDGVSKNKAGQQGSSARMEKLSSRRRLMPRPEPGNTVSLTALNKPKGGK